MLSFIYFILEERLIQRCLAMAELSRKERCKRLVNEVFCFWPKEAQDILQVAQESTAELDAVVCQSNREFIWRKKKVKNDDSYATMISDRASNQVNKGTYK